MIVIPHVPSPEDRLEPAVLHGTEQNLIHLIAKRRILRCGDPDVIAGAYVGRLIHEPGIPPDSALCEHVIQQDRVHATQNQVGVRMYVVLINDWLDFEL